jgi:predicted phage terminase large subunit-like protein
MFNHLLTPQSSAPAVSRRDAAAELLRRRAARKSLHAFIKFTNDDYIESAFSLDLCAHLDQFIVDMFAGLRPVLVIEAPPQHGKTEIVSRHLPAFVFGLNQNLRVGGLSYGQGLASDINRDIQRIMMSDEYGMLFPEAALNSKRVITSKDLEAKRNSEEFELVGARGSYIASGVGGLLTGRKLDLGIIDDPIKNSKEAFSDTTKESLFSWYKSTFLTRLSKNSGQIVMATRWATDDLSGRILETNNRAMKLNYKAISDDFMPLVPELHPIEKLWEMKVLLGSYFWSAMYEGSPAPIGGGIYKGEWWRYYKLLPVMVFRVIFADTAQKTDEQNDYTVFQCWGKGDDGRAYLIDLIRAKWEAPQLLIQARAFWNKHNADRTSPLRAFKVEDKSSGTGLIQQLEQGDATHPPIPVVAIPRDRDKVTRAYDTTPRIEAGMVVLPEDAPWLSDYLAEFAVFPNGKHDDMIDPTMDAVADIFGGYVTDFSKVL